MSEEITQLTALAHEGSTRPLTTTPVVGTPARPQVTGPPMSAPHNPPAWWAEKLLVDRGLVASRERAPARARAASLPR